MTDFNQLDDEELDPSLLMDDEGDFAPMPSRSPASAPMSPPDRGEPVSQPPQGGMNAADLERAHDQAMAQKGMMRGLGAIADNLGNRQSFGNFYLHQLNQPNHGARDSMNAAADAVEDPYARQKNLLEQYQIAKQMKQSQGQDDPNGLMTRLSKSVAGSAVGSLASNPDYAKNPQMAASLKEIQAMIQDPKTTATDINAAVEKNPLLKEMFTNSLAGQKLKAQMAMFGQRQDIANRRLGITEDNQAAAAGDKIDKNPIIQRLTTQQQQIRRDMHTLETADKLTPQLLNEIQIGIANAISGGKSSAQGTQEKTEFNSLELGMKNLQQRLSNSPQDIGSPEVKKYIADVLNRLDAGYQNNLAQQAKTISNGRKYSHNPNAQRALDDKVNSYQPGAQAPEGKAPPHGNTVYQNGHMYNWNPQSGQYE